MSFWIAAIALGLAASPATDRTSLIAAADAFDRAQIAKDGTTIAAMLHDDFIFVDGSGKRLGRKEFIAGWTASGDRFDPITLVDRKVTMLGRDAGVVSAEVNLCGQSGGAPFCSRIRFADTFVKVRGKWRAAFIQVTRIA